MNDPIGRMGMEPVEAVSVLEYANPSGESDGCSVLQQREVSVEVCLDHLGLAVDAVDW